MKNRILYFFVMWWILAFVDQIGFSDNKVQQTKPLNESLSTKTVCPNTNFIRRSTGEADPPNWICNEINSIQVKEGSALLTIKSSNATEDRNYLPKFDSFNHRDKLTIPIIREFIKNLISHGQFTREVRHWPLGQFNPLDVWAIELLLMLQKGKECSLWNSPAAKETKVVGKYWELSNDESRSSNNFDVDMYERLELPADIYVKTRDDFFKCVQNSAGGKEWIKGSTQNSHR